jgi:hypothetical protein
MAGAGFRAHRWRFTAKPGYDPVELFLDPAIRMPALTVGWKLARRKLGSPHAAGRHPASTRLCQGTHTAADAAATDIVARVFLTRRKDLARRANQVHRRQSLLLQRI